MKSIIVIYDDLFELDRTEVAYQGETQLKSIVKSLMADHPESEKAEVYNKITQSLVYAYKRDIKGNISEIERYVKRPSKRKTAAMAPDPKYPKRMTFWMNDAVYDRLDNLRGHRAAFVRKAVEEKLEREGDPLPIDPCPKAEGHPDRRYHRMFKNLPQSLRTYDARTTYRSPLTIVKTPDNLWRVSYGEYSTLQGAPSTENKDLLSALEWLDMWIKKYGNKWIVGKVIKDEEK
jgi:hypothetical protein